MSTSLADSERGSEELNELFKKFKLSSNKADKQANKQAFHDALVARFPEDGNRKEAGAKIAKRYEEACKAEKVASEKAIAKAKAVAQAKASFPGVTITSKWTAKDGSWRADVVVKGVSYHIKLFLDGSFHIFGEDRQQVAVGNKLPENTGYVKLHGLTFKDGEETQVNWNNKLTQLQVATAAILEINTQPVLARVPISSAPKPFIPTKEPSLLEAYRNALAPTATSSSVAPWKTVVASAPDVAPVAVVVTHAPSEKQTHSTEEDLDELAKQLLNIQAKYKAKKHLLIEEKRMQLKLAQADAQACQEKLDELELTAD